MEWLKDTWVFIKASPWTFAAGGLILVAAIAGVIYGVMKHYDRGFMKRDGKKLYWEKKNIPLVIALTREVSALYTAAIHSVIAEVNAFCQRDILHTSVRQWWSAEDISGTTTVINVLIDIDQTLPVHVGGRVELKWDKRTGELLASHIKLPETILDTTNPYVVVAHEIGHSLGLDHDDKSDSMMHEVLSDRRQDFTESDKKRLRRQYS